MYSIKNNIEYLFIYPGLGKWGKAWLGLMSPLEDIEGRLPAIFSREAAGGDVGLRSAPCCIPNAVSLGQRYTVNTNEMEPCLLTSPLQGGGCERKTMCLLESYYTPPPATKS